MSTQIHGDLILIVVSTAPGFLVAEMAVRYLHGDILDLVGSKIIIEGRDSAFVH